MKLKTLLLSFMLLAVVAAKADNMARIILMHNGQSTMFAGDRINDALTQAVDGDTIYLSEGHFPTFTISKKILVRGAGENTNIANGVNINIMGEPVLTMPVLEGVKINGSLIIQRNCTNLIIRNCVFNTFQNSATSTPNGLVELCHCFGTFNISEHMTDFYVKNTDLNYLKGASLNHNKCNFINCLIYGAAPETTAGRFVNCQIQRWNPIKASMLLKTLVYTYSAKVGDSSIAQDCYYDNYNTSGSWFSSNQLITNGYLGLDGSIVGNWGGATPFTGTFRLKIPYEESGTISVDNEKKKINVELEILPE